MANETDNWLSNNNAHWGVISDYYHAIQGDSVNLAGTVFQAQNRYSWYIHHQDDSDTQPKKFPVYNCIAGLVVNTSIVNESSAAVTVAQAVVA